MIKISAKTYDYKIVVQQLEFGCDYIRPFFRDKAGSTRIWLVSPQHGRSYVVGKKNDGGYVISKGNGLSYTDKTIIKTPDQIKDIWGLLSKEDALRDFNVGNEVAALGIKTNQMEAVIELDLNCFTRNEEVIKPILLQYSVECPYRISDAAFISRKDIQKYVNSWNNLDKWHCDSNYKIAANVLISNLRILHDHKILHNALTSQNITWALELLDFEIASSPAYPYENEDYVRHIPDLFNREILHIYQIILDIAWILREQPDYGYLDSLFRDYGFDLEKEFAYTPAQGPDSCSGIRF